MEFLEGLKFTELSPSGLWRSPVTGDFAGSNPASSANLSRFGVMVAPLPEEQVVYVRIIQSGPVHEQGGICNSY